jgi:hypothetical protein
MNSHLRADIGVPIVGVLSGRVSYGWEGNLSHVHRGNQRPGCDIEPVCFAEAASLQELGLPFSQRSRAQASSPGNDE